MADKRVDASLNVTLNGIRVSSEHVAAVLKVPMGEVVAWGVAFPSRPTTLPPGYVPRWQREEQA